MRRGRARRSAAGPSPSPTRSRSSKRRGMQASTPPVDLSPAEAGRDVRFVEQVSRRSGMHIVVCTGQRLFPVELKERSTAELTELFIKEIEQGIDDTGIKAGVIKAATV